MIVRACQDQASVLAGNSTPDPFVVCFDHFYTVSAFREGLVEETPAETYEEAISHRRTVWSRLALAKRSSPGMKRTEDMECSCPRSVAKFL
jgi:hypothetical protein